MNYIWDVLIRAKEQGYQQKDISFVPERHANPYRELGTRMVNQQTVTKTPVHVNSYYRFPNIFESLLQAEEQIGRESLNALFSSLVHFLGMVDLKQGLCKREYYKQALEQDVRRGVYGNEYTTVLDTFTNQQKDALLTSLLTQYMTGTSVWLLTQLLKSIFPKSIVYYDDFAGRELLVYIGKQRDAQLQLQVDFILNTFAPLDYEQQVFWDKHFGIIGVDETMQIGEIQLF